MVEKEKHGPAHWKLPRAAMTRMTTPWHCKYCCIELAGRQRCDQSSKVATPRVPFLQVAVCRLGTARNITLWTFSFLVMVLKHFRDSISVCRCDRLPLLAMAVLNSAMVPQVTRPRGKDTPDVLLEAHKQSSDKRKVCCTGNNRQKETTHNVRWMSVPWNLHLCKQRNAEGQRPWLPFIVHKQAVAQTACKKGSQYYDTPPWRCETCFRQEVCCTLWKVPGSKAVKLQCVIYRGC